MIHILACETGRGRGGRLPAARVCVNVLARAAHEPLGQVLTSDRALGASWKVSIRWEPARAASREVDVRDLYLNYFGHMCCARFDCVWLLRRAQASDRAFSMTFPY